MQKFFVSSFVSVFFTSLFIIIFSAFGFAQDLDNVTITGKVTDSNNAPIVGASVVAKLTTTGTERTVVTDDEGRFTVVKLEPGTYSVKFSAQGFGAKEQKDLVTVAGQNVQLNISLSPANVTAEQTITIDGDDAPVVDTTRIVVGGTLVAKELEEIPNASRNPLDLVLTLGGTSEEALSTKDLAEDRQAANRLAPTEQGNFSLSGGASYSNNLTIDGLDNNDDRTANSRFTPSLESIAEVQVITNQFSAEYGRAAGSRVNLRTKAGGNKFHGRAFMFFRDDNLNANTYYNNSRGLARLPMTDYNPGFTLSGPVIIPFGEGKSIYDGHNRTFFAVSYENDNLRDTTLIDAYVPVLTGRFTLPAATNSAPVCETNSTTSTCINGGATFIAPYSKTIATPNLKNIFTARVDHRFSESNDATFGFQFGRTRNQRQNIASTTKLEEALQGTSNSTEAYNFTDNYVFGAKAVNQFRMQYSNYEPSYEAENPEVPVVLIGYIDPRFTTSNTRTLIAGNSTASLTASGIFADKRREKRWQFQDSLTYIAGLHTFKGGFDWQRVSSFNLDQGDATGTYNFANSGTGTTTANYTGACAPTPCTPTTVSYSAVQNYVLNQVTRFRQNFGTGSSVKNTYWSLFLNDEMRLNSNLTLSLGLRYEKEKVIGDNNNFGPRFGVAWDPFKKGTGVIRFGAGIFYNRVLLRSIDDFIITGQQESFDTANLTTTVGVSAATKLLVMRALSNNFPKRYASPQEIKDLINPILGVAAGAGFTTGNDALTRFVNTATLQVPESYQFNVGFEREILKGFVFEANYTWNKTVHLWGESNPNAPSLAIANSTSGTNYADWTAYLAANPYVVTNANGTKATYNFYLGATTDNIGATTAQGGTTACSTSTTTTFTCFVNLNTINPSEAASSPIGLALAAINKFRPRFPNTNQLELMASDRKSFYQGLILEFRSRYKKMGAGFGGNFRAAYTLSKLMDDGLNNTSDAEANGDFGREWSRAGQDRRHRLAFSGTFDTPNWFGKLRFSPLVRFGSSAPFNLSYNGIDRNLDDVANDRQNFSGNLADLKWRKPGSSVPTELLSQFSLQPIGAKGGNLPRNAGIGPILFTFDLNVTREFKIGERYKLRPTIEFGNILNASVLSFGSGFVDYATFGSSVAQQAAKVVFERDEFLIPTRAYRPRDIRLGLRFDF